MRNVIDLRGGGFTGIFTHNVIDFRPIYKPLINYAWTTSPVVSEYLTDEVEIYTNSDVILDTGWTDNEDGTYSCDGTSGFIRLGKLIQSPESAYSLSIEVINISGGSVSNFTNGYSGGVVFYTETGVFIENKIWKNYGTGGSSTSYDVYIESSNFAGIIRPLSIQKILQEPNKRYLQDIGASPKYPAILKSGQGVKFNGVDQNIQVNKTDISTRLGDFTVIASFDSLNTTTRSKILYSTFASVYFEQSSVNTVVLQLETSSDSVSNKRITYTLNTPSGLNNYLIMRKGNYIHFGINGDIVGAEQIPDGFEINRYNAAGAGCIGGVTDWNQVFTGIISNIIELGFALTPAQIKYQYNYPEKFLYHEKQIDGTFIPKSEVLTRDELDKVITHIPLCETDGYIRNMIGYSEGVELLNEPSFNDTTNFIFSTNASVTAGQLSINVTDGGMEYGYDNSVLDVMFQGKVYLVTFDVESCDGVFALCDGAGNNIVNNSAYFDSSGISSVIITSDATYNDLGIKRVTLSGTYSCVVNSYSVRELSSTYPIQNYTVACRDDAKQLSTGLQTCFWKRDVLGVPYSSSFDAMEFDGVWYANTGWIPDTTKYFHIEIVLQVNRKSSDVYMGTIATDRLFIAIDKSLNRIKYAIGDMTSSYTNTVEDGKYIHFQLIYNTTNCISFENGEFLQDAQTNVVTQTTPFLLGTEDYFKRVYNGDIRLFKIHTEPKDPTELYNKVVKKGLLQ